MPASRREKQPVASASLFEGEERPGLLLLIDGHAMVHRAWHAIQTPMTVSRTGEEVRAVYGFANIFLRALLDWKPTHCAIAFDLPGPTFRDKLYAEYKAQRPETPQELRDQFVRVRQLVEAFSVPIYEMEEYEADDVLGTLCHQAEKQELPTVILTGDMDMLQLVSPWVRVDMYSNRVQYDETAVAEHYGGLRPYQQPDVKALEGDSSDNIPGVPGVGRVGAVKLIRQFGSIEELVDRLDEVEPPKLRQTLWEQREKVVLAKELTTIVRDLPLKLDLERSRFGQYDRERVLELLRELEITNIVARIPPGELDSQPSEGVAIRQEEATDYRTVTTEAELEELVKHLASSDGFAFDTETTSTDAMQAELVGMSFSTKAGEGFYVPVGHREGEQVPMERALEMVRPVLADEGIPKAAHNANYDLTVLANAGVEVRNMAFDTMVGAFVVGEKTLGLKGLAFSRLGVEMTPISELIGTGRKQVTMDAVPVDHAAPYAAADADMTWRLKELFEGRLKAEPKLLELFTTLEMPLLPVLVRMERHGIAMDGAALRAMGKELAEELGRLEGEIYNAVGHQFNIRSPVQLGGVLFQELRLPGGKRTKTGFSTDAAVLEGLRGAHPVIELVLRYRELDKLKSTYVDALPDLVNPRTGRIHTSYNLAGSATGRISSSDPNLQNIPVRTELGRRVRRAFVAQDAPDWVLLSADYSQIELRVLAHLSQDAGLLEAFHRDEDIHAATASATYGVSLDEVTLEMRRIAKVMNFGVVYGLSAHGIAQQTELSREEGAKFIETYFGRYPGILGYLEETKRKAREDGYVETLLGRRRYLPEMLSSNFQIRQAAERMAVNMPVQGTAADVIKVAMLPLDQALTRGRLRTQMLLQVHDELIFEVPREELEEVEGLVLELMPQAMELAVPLKVELKTGSNWGDME